MMDSKQVVLDLMSELRKTIEVCEHIQENEPDNRMYDKEALKHHLSAYRSVYDQITHLMSKHST